MSGLENAQQYRVFAADREKQEAKKPRSQEAKKPRSVPSSPQ